MDKTKRGFELAGAIIILVLGAFMILGSLMCLVSYDSFQAIFEEMYDFSSYDATLLAGMMQGIFAFLLLYSIALVIFSALLLPSPIKNGQYRKRLGIKITFLILVGLFVLLTLDGGILFSLLVLAAFVFVLLLNGNQFNILRGVTTCTRFGSSSLLIYIGFTSPVN